MSLSILKGLHRRALGISKDNQIVAPSGLVSGGEGSPVFVHPGPGSPAIIDDFLTGNFNGTAAVDTGQAGIYFNAKCTDTGVKGALVDGTGGVFRITSSETITTATPTGSSKAVVGKTLAWKGNQGPGAYSGCLRMGARVKASAYPTKTSGDWSGFFVGFTDNLAHEVPMYDTGRTGDSGASAISPANDAVGFLWGTGGDTGIRGVSTTSGSGGANDSGDQQVTLTTARPTANAWMVFEVELVRGQGDTGGFANFYIDGALKGKINSPVNPTIALTPIVSYYDTGGANTFDIDWINVSAPRDTGM
jgi:hypothetical protein